MQEPDWDRIQDIYHDALKLPVAERSAFVAKATDDPFVTKEVNELIDVSASVGDFLDTPVVELNLPATAENLVGTTINQRYYLERKLDAGGMGQLYVARDAKVSGRAVVIKFLLRELLENEYARQKFVQESQALALIRHPGVVEVLDTGEFDDVPYFVMQFIDGTTLDSHTPNHGMKLERAASILKLIGAALAHVHEQGVFHRDLKPKNIMLRRGTDSVVLVDFGIARITDPTIGPTETTEISAGTLPYMSPEQLHGEEVTAASDVYSMALIAYEMVTGRRAFEATTPARHYEQQRAGVKPKPRALRQDLSPKAQEIILRGMSFKAAARYRDANQFGESLAQALMTDKVNGHPWLRRSMIVLGAALLSLLIYIFWPLPKRTLNYYLTVQNTRDAQPVKSHGEEIFTTGDKFQLTVVPPEPGYLYIFHEGPPAANDPSFTMLHPRQTINDGSASLGADQPVQFDWITFRGPPGAENFWMVWSPSPVDELESVKAEAFNHPKAGLSVQTLATIKEYLSAKRSVSSPTTFNYKAKQEAVVRGKGDPLVTFEQFKHR